jgi:hypothetical protein
MRPRIKLNGRTVSAAFILAMLLSTPARLSAQVAPPLGTAARFGALANSGVTGSAGGGTVVSGDVGSSPTPTISNFPPSSVAPPFTLHGGNDGVVQQARIDAIAAYNQMVAQGPGVVLPDNLGGGVTLVSGIYSFATGTPNLPAGNTLTLNGGGVFIFNVGAGMTFNVNSVVAGTANPCNIFWRVGTSATLNGVNFRGTVIADASITLGSGNIEGRLLAGTGATGAITMASGGNTIGGCSTAVSCPALSILPTAVPNATLGVSYGQPLTVSGGTAPFLFSATGALPAGFTLTSGGLLGGTATNLTPETFIVRGTDNAGCSAQRSYTMFIVEAGTTPPQPGCPVISVSPATLPAGAVGVAYNQTFTVTGGVAPFTFTRSAGGFAAGITLSSAGVLSGTPTASALLPVTIRVTDANGCFVEREYVTSVTVGVPTLPQTFLIMLALTLAMIGYYQMSRRARA